jgi:DNA-binding transcriptional MerR regulator/DNA gyrase inhibitor GyrI
MTISQVAKICDISTRTLRYYEEVGLIESSKKNDYSYRTYDEKNLKKLRQILILRKLRIKLKDISNIIDNQNIDELIQTLNNCLNSVNEEIEALEILKNTYLQLFQFIEKKNISVPDFEYDELNEIMTLIQNIPEIPSIFDSERSSNYSIVKADEVINRLKDNDVRIIYMPEYTVASAHYIGNNPEEISQSIMDQFVSNSNLAYKKHDIRLFGFNNPSPSQMDDEYGYEYWITIPDDLEVPPPLVKKHFDGGLYAAHAIKMGDFHQWRLLDMWVTNSDEYEKDVREPLGMNGSLEEHLNAFSFYRTAKENAPFAQLDLLLPIKLKESV